VVTPQLAFVLSSLLAEPIQQSINAYDLLERVSGVGVLDLLLTGFYPTFTFIPFVIAGMALARLDLAAGIVQRRLAAFGPALIVLGYGASVLLAGADALRSTAEDASGSSGSASSAPSGAASLLLAGPHSGTTFDIIGSVGVAITVILCATVALNRLPWLHRLTKPAIAVGSMSLTAYVGHFVVEFGLASPSETETQQSWVPLLMYILGAMLFALTWSRFFRRGPLEYPSGPRRRPATTPGARPGSEPAQPVDTPGTPSTPTTAMTPCSCFSDAAPRAHRGGLTSPRDTLPVRRPST
jgi:uncharacterized protein